MPKPKGKKGDPRIIVKMSDIETATFGKGKDLDGIYTTEKKKDKRGVRSPEEWKSVDMEDAPGEIELDTADNVKVNEVEVVKKDGEDESSFPRTRIRPPQSQSAVNGSVGGEKSWAERGLETAEMLRKRHEGQKRAEERELVRNAARRAVVFGLVSKKSSKRRAEELQQPEGIGRKCEALMNGKVVEPSFAKGDWCIRWRDG